MKRLPIFAALTASAISISSLAAQDAAATAAATAARVQAGGADSGWHLPLHAAPGVANPSRLWASGDTYKASFDDGMTFYPVLGESAPNNLPWRWRTLAIGRAHNASLVDAEDVASREAGNGGFRYELDYGTGDGGDHIEEIYEIRAEGVEQLFELDAMPAGSGDLVVRGRIDSELECAPRGPAHEPLVFRDQSGNPVVGYGAATAIDANGATLALETSYDGGVLEIRVPATWLENAAFPLTIDPLTSRVTASASSTSVAYCPQVAHDQDNNRFALHDVRSVSGSDRDIRLRRYTPTFGSVNTLFANLTTTDTRFGSVAVAHGPNKWLLAYQARTAIDSSVRVYFHDTGSTGLNSGTSRTVSRPVGFHDSVPSIGGSRSGDRAFLALRRDLAGSPINTERSFPLGFFVDPDDETIGTAVGLHTNPGSNFDAERIQVTQLASGGSGWLTLWQEYNFDNPGDDWDLIGQRVDGSGNLVGHAVFGQSGTSSQHKIGPAVAGMLGEYGIFYMTTPNTGTRYTGRRAQRLWFQRVEWSTGSTTPTFVGTPTMIDEGPNNFSLEFGESSRGAAFDNVTYGNWGAVWRDATAGDLRIARVAFDADVVEDAVLEANPMTAFGGYFQPSITFDREIPGFVAAYVSANVAANDPIYTRRLNYPSDAAAVEYGNSCFGRILYENNAAPPYAGSPNSYLSITGAVASAPTWLLVGTSPTDVALPGGFTGCRLLVSTMPEILTAATLVTNSSGNAGLPLPIPGEAAGLDLYWQAISLDQGFLWSTDALEMCIR